MGKNKPVIILLVMVSLVLTGCWNYREIEQLSIVGGMGLDMQTGDGQYILTVELVKIEGGQDIQPKSQVITMKGNTLFNAVREIIAITGRKLYWSHAKVVIIDEDIARDGMTKVVDWYLRDAETRPDEYLIITRGASAKEILQTAQGSDEILLPAVGYD